MTIHYTGPDEFYDGIAALVQRGLTFRASAKDLTITLLGGF